MGRGDHLAVVAVAQRQMGRSGQIAVPVIVPRCGLVAVAVAAVVVVGLKRTTGSAHSAAAVAARNPGAVETTRTDRYHSGVVVVAADDDDTVGTHVHTLLDGLVVARKNPDHHQFVGIAVVQTPKGRPLPLLL